MVSDSTTQNMIKQDGFRIGLYTFFVNRKSQDKYTKIMNTRHFWSCFTSSEGDDQPHLESSREEILIMCLFADFSIVWWSVVSMVIFLVISVAGHVSLIFCVCFPVVRWYFFGKKRLPKPAGTSPHVEFFGGLTFGVQRWNAAEVFQEVPHQGPVGISGRHSATPKSSNMDDHDLVLKPVVTTGAAPF